MILWSAAVQGTEFVSTPAEDEPSQLTFQTGEKRHMDKSQFDLQN